MKKYIPYLVIFLVGAVIGMWLCRQYHFRYTTNEVQRDTVTVFDTARHSRLELVRNTYRLDIPKIGFPELVYIPSDSTTIIYRDSVRYVTLPRQYFYTRTADAEVYHSGIDSRIDALNVFHKTQAITKTVTQTVTKRHELSLGIEANYFMAPSTPIKLKYTYHAVPWFSVYGYAEHDLLSREFGVGAGTSIDFRW